MDYIKIAEIANRCEVVQRQITEYHRFVGKNIAVLDGFIKDIAIKEAIDDLEKELNSLKRRLKKSVGV